MCKNHWLFGGNPVLLKQITSLLGSFHLSAYMVLLSFMAQLSNITVELMIFQIVCGIKLNGKMFMESL